MTMLDPGKLHVTYLPGVGADGPLPGGSAAAARRYTLTHSDLTGDLFLAIGAEYDRKATSAFYTRLMRDEVLAEWLPGLQGGALPSLHVYVHVSGGFTFGSAAWRNDILLYHLPQVLEAFRHGDRALFDAHPELDNSVVQVHFRSAQVKFHRVEDWGRIETYRL